MSTILERKLSPEALAEHEAALARARGEQAAGDDASAERRMREVLDATRGSGTLVAWIALANLTGLYQRQGRESETLLLTRRLADTAGAFEPFRATWARQAYCMALANLDDWPRVAHELPRFEAGIAGAPEIHRLIFARSARALRATAALHCGSLDEARAAHAELAASLDESAAPNTRRYVHLIGAEVEQRAGRFAQALAAARAARPYAASAVEALAGVVVEAECLLELGESRKAHETVRSAIADVETAAGPIRSSALLVKAGPRLAALAIDRFGDDDLARRIYDLAAAAVVRRASEIGRALLDLPELADPHPEDAASLAAFRASFTADKRAFLAAVTRMLGDHPGAAFLRDGDLRLLRVCAWCVRVRDLEGRWAPTGHLLTGEEGAVTHGICEACAAGLRSPAAAAAG